MKKIYAFIVVVAAAAMVSCAGNANKQAAAEAETVEVAVEEVSESCGECADSVKADSCCKAEAAVEEVEFFLPFLASAFEQARLRSA